MDFLKRLTELSEAKGIKNNYQLAEKSGVPYTTIDNFYRKGYQNAKLSTIKKLAVFFGCSLDYLLEGSLPQTKKAPDIIAESKYQSIIDLLDKLTFEQVCRAKGYIERMVEENEAAENAAKQTTNVG